MNIILPNPNFCASRLFDVTEDDIIEAMMDNKGYVDITPGHFRELYGLAHHHAVDRVTHSVKARDVMVEKVIFVHRDIPLEAVAQTMATHAIAGVPVVDGEKSVAGVISEKDFFFRMSSKGATSFMSVVAQCLRNNWVDLSTMRRQKAEEIMTSPAITVREDVPVSEIADILTEKNIRRVPVTDQAGKLIGIVSQTDISRLSCLLAI